MKETETLGPAQVFQQSKDKQRVVITGSQATMITAIVVFALRQFHREFDLVLAGSLSAAGITDAPLIIIEQSAGPALLDYHHHIGVVSEMPALLDSIDEFANATPKGGVLIYSELEPVGSMGKKERPHITSVPYTTYPNVVSNGTVSLLSSQKEKTMIHLTGDSNLRNVSAAKEILKKVGIASPQFYEAIRLFEA